MDFSREVLIRHKNNLIIAIKRLQFGKKAQLAFIEDLYTLVNDGIPANRAIEMMGLVSEGVVRDVALSLSQSIAEGKPLAEGMGKWFAQNVVEIIRVGESGGALAQALKSAINMMSQSGVAMSAFVAAVTYPMIVIAMSCAMIVYMNNNILPQFRLIKPDTEWPPAGKRLVSIAHIVQHWWWVFVVVAVVIVMVLRRMCTHYVGHLRATLDRFPPFSFYKRLVAARMLETLGLLVANGVIFKTAIKVMQLQANPYLHMHLVEMEHLLSMGKSNIADVLATGLVREQDLVRLRVMAEVKGFEHGLIRMGVKGAEDATNTLKTISKIIGSMLMVVGGLLILSIVQGIYLTGMGLAS